METEVICISSDESDSQKENKKKSTPEKVEENNFKRKISQIREVKRSPSYNNTEKRRKLSKSQNTLEADTDGIATSDCVLILNKEQESMADVPKLIVKERKKISYVAHDIFPQFISLCLKKCHDGDMKKIVNKLKRRYEELDPIYAGSEDFALFLNEKREAIMSNDKRLYVYIEEVMNEMKRVIKEQLKMKRTNSVVYDAIPSTSYVTKKVSDNNVTRSDNESEDIEDLDSETKRKIKTISVAMKKCELRIKKLENAEVDFDDDADSNYIKMERYKQRMIELYNKLCEITGENADAGRSYLRPKHISTTQIVAVDQAITNFINSKISKRNQLKKIGSFTNNLIFPDYRDILECVNRCNDKRNLGLDKRKQQQMAKKAFIELGEFLQRARQNDYWDTFSLYLENTEEDPAIKDKELAQKLAQNRSEGDKRLAAVFEKYTKKQELKDQIINGRTTTEDESDMDDDDKDLDEDKDTCRDVLSLSSSNNENDDSEEDVDEIIEDKVLLAEKNKNNMVNVDRSTRITSNNTEKNDLQEKCDKKVEIKTLTKENDVTVSNKSENRIAINGEKMNKSLPICKTVVNSRNLTGTVMQKTHKDSLSTFTTNYADTTGETEEHVAEMMKQDMSEMITTNSATEVMSAGGATELTENVAELITGDIATEVITEDLEELITGNLEEVITEVTEVVTRKTPIDMLTVDTSSDKPVDEATKKPLLRVRSFARPPTTWDDGRQIKTTGKTVQENMPKITSQNKDVIDLTDESNVNESTPTAPTTPVVAKRAIQLSGKMVPLKTKHQTLVLPSGGNYICVQNTTNNYLKVDMRTGEIIAPVRDVQTPTIIRMPSTQTASVRQVQLQNASITTTTNEAPTKRSETILRIIPKKTFVVKTSEAQVIPKAQVISKAQVIPKTQVRVLPLTKPK